MRQSAQDLSGIADWLTRLHHAIPETLHYQILAGGASGSSVYRLVLPTKTVVLKVTVAGTAPYVLERARREVAFYRYLPMQIPLRVPDILASYDEPDYGCALLLNAYPPAKTPEKWSRADYVEMANQLACFHAAFWNTTERLAQYSWVRPIQTEDVEAHRQQALILWEALKEHHPDVFEEYTLERIEQGLEHLFRLRRSLATFPLTLCHNDCHIGNLLCDENRLLWADWQEVGLGHGPEDLAFLYQRADTPPDLTVILSYQQRLEAETGASIPLEEVHNVIISSELWTRLVHWPGYLVSATHERVAYHIQRVEALLHGV